MLFIAGLVLTILGLMGILSNQLHHISAYFVFGLGLVLLIVHQFIKPRDKKN